MNIKDYHWKKSFTDPDKKDVKEVSKRYNLSKVASKILLRRKVKNIHRFLNPTYQGLYNPYLFRDMMKAVARIQKARSNNEKVLIHGDYDVDGITSTALIKMMCENIGITNVKLFCPPRSLGYGFSEKIARKASDWGINLIITCDCGSNEHKSHRIAKRKGIDVIVLDHHSYKDPPKVFAFINPHEPGYPFGELCAAAVAFKLVQAMNLQPDSLNKGRLLKTFPTSYLELVAIATIADSVPLVDENRILVKEGLKRINKTENLGLISLLKACGIYRRRTTVEMVGFIIAPKINAPGRLSTPKISLNLYLSQSEERADFLSKKMVKINKKRMEINREIQKEAALIIEKEYSEDYFIVLDSRIWNKGVVGIVASTIVEIYHKPCVIIANGYGSVRTVPEFPLLGALAECQDLFVRWGGHPMAAGLHIRKKNIKEFRKRINKIASRTLTNHPNLSMSYDEKIRLKDVNYGLLEDIEKLEPFGQGNPMPNFITEDISVVRNRVTKDGQHFQVSLRQGKSLLSGVGFWMAQHNVLVKDPAQNFDVLFSVERNNKNYEQMLLKDLKEVKLNW